MKKLILSGLLLNTLLAQAAQACSLTKLENIEVLKTSRLAWNGGVYTCDNSGCHAEGLKYTYWKPLDGNTLRLPRFRFSQDIPQEIINGMLDSIELELLGLPKGILEYEKVPNEQAFEVGNDRWFNFGVIYPADTPYFRNLLAYANLQEGNFSHDPVKDQYETLGGNLRIVTYFLNGNLSNEQKVKVLIHEFLHYFISHSQGDTVVYDYPYPRAKKRAWIVGRIDKPLPIMYPTPADEHTEILQEDKAQFRQVFGLPQDKDTVTISGVVTWEGLPVKAARLTFVSKERPDYSYNVYIDRLRKGNGEFTIYGLKKGSYEIRLEIVNPLYVDLTEWNKITDKPEGLVGASYLKNKKGNRKVFKFNSDNDNFNLEFVK